MFSIYFHSIQAYSFVPSLSHDWDVIRGSMYVRFQFLWSSIVGMPSQVLPKISQLFLWFLIVVTPSQFLSMFVLRSFGFQTFLCYPRLLSMFNVISFGFHSQGSHPRFYLSLFVSHLQDTALCSIYVNSQFHWFPIIGMPSQALSKLIRLLIIGTLFLVLSIFILSSLRFPSLGCHLRFYLSLFICSFDSSSLDLYMVLRFFSFP